MYLFASGRVILLLTALWAAAALAGQDSKEKADESKSRAAPTIYTPGGDVKPPKVVHYVEPKSSSSSKEAFAEGVVKLTSVVTPDGLPSDVRVTKGLNGEEDQRAVDAVKEWRFQPGTKDGKAVYVRVNIEIEFHLL